MTGLPLRLAVLLLAVTLGAGCIDDYYRPAPERAEMPPNALRVGITPTYPPMIFKQGAQITGAEADLARLLARETGLLRRGSLGPADRCADRGQDRHHHVGHVGDGGA